MPWMETAPVEQRERFIRDHRLELYTMAELCARYGIAGPRFEPARIDREFVC
jgi:hypothetical protein